MIINHGQKWWGRYRDIGFEIFKDSDPNTSFCGYLLLNSRSNPEIKNYQEVVTGLKSCILSIPCPEFYYQFSWNYGVTFYQASKIEDMLCVKIGHDYGHLWDRKGHISDSHCADDLKLIIDQYRAIHPEKKEDGT